MEIAILQFILTKGVGVEAIRKLCHWAMEHGDGLEDMMQSDVLLTQAIGLRHTLAENVVRSRDNALRLNDELKDQKVSLVWLGHKDYPRDALETLGRKAPPYLFLKGNRELLRTTGVGFCGSRKASAKGLLISTECAEDLAHRGICVVSGYANGVDVSAHMSALKSSGSTIFVLAEGILQCKEKAGFDEVLSPSNGLFVSQFPPKATWFATNAMQRNSTIIALSRAMVVIEAGESGGSIAAGRAALELHKPLFVVDYATPPPSAAGNRLLLQDGGHRLRMGTRRRPNLKPLMSTILGDESTRNHVYQEELFSSLQPEKPA